LLKGFVNPRSNKKTDDFLRYSAEACEKTHDAQNKVDAKPASALYFMQSWQNDAASP